MPNATETRPGAPHGMALLNDPTLDKGTAFTAEERRQYAIEGLLPHAVESIDRQVGRVLGHLSAKPTDLERYIYLIGLEDRNETLFYRTNVRSGAFHPHPLRSDCRRCLPCLWPHLPAGTRHVHHPRHEGPHG